MPAGSATGQVRVAFVHRRAMAALDLEVLTSIGPIGRIIHCLRRVGQSYSHLGSLRRPRPEITLQLPAKSRIGRSKGYRKRMGLLRY
jgi:hypothetical protein